jgi:hypothetical protein
MVGILVGGTVLVGVAVGGAAVVVTTLSREVWS